ncbi:hypothetical protein PHMEG_00021652 [Phytophthora megakarya]|uniref:DUF3730 domain-containing protein n=1 Tax=Phytophthora megakarya TaxID=4795 RepID=A0A225VML0_9STRA|nr:hypothetical protein PHMEG_00021652 [Phytophthora megakarya]
MVGEPPTLAALLRALRQASTVAAASTAVEHAVDRLISSPSLPEAQNLVFGLEQCAKDHHSALTTSLYEQVQQAAAICTEPSSKAEFLGFVLLMESVHLLGTLQVSTQRQVLLKVFNANNGVLSGYLAALTAADGPFLSPVVDCSCALKTLEIVSPVFKSVLMDDQQTSGQKGAVLDTLSRIAWSFDGQLEDHQTVQTSTVRILVEALELVPHSQLSQGTYVAHVALVADLLSSFAAQNKEQVELTARTARFVLESTQILIGRDVGVLALLQSLEQLAQTVPEALWCSVFLTSTAYFMVDKCETPLEQQIILRVLGHVLTFGQNFVSGQVDMRSVYVEILLLPLSSMISLHGNAVSELLKLVVDIISVSTYYHQDGFENNTPTETAIHARSAVRLVGDKEECESWLNSLFQSIDEMFSYGDNSTNKWLALLLVALLSDRRSTLRGCAAKCFERQVNTNPKFWGGSTTKALVASLVFLVSQNPPADKTASARRFGEWMASCMYSLAGLAATTTDTMRIVLRLIDSMNATVKMQPMALKIMYEVWRNESRVFPRLEGMLFELTSPDEDVERHIVRMATIKTLCEKDPELGVQFISSIQGFLEDELKSVVSMAMDAITALCRGDCLDFYVAFKILAQKMRKNKVTCADNPLFQERLCCFYTLGGTESAANEKHAVKLINQTWEFADSEHSKVRKAAYAALCNFPLDMLGLCRATDAIAIQESDDEDQMTEEEVEEQLDDLMQRLQNEHDLDVRVEIEKLASRVIEHESTKLTASVGRGQRMASATSGSQRHLQQGSQQTGSGTVVSAAATKELQALLPSRAEIQAMFSTSSATDLSGFLLAYQPKAVIDSKNAKRKDKVVRLATQNLDEVVETLSTVLQSMELPWGSTNPSTQGDENCKVFVRTLALMEGWRGFMSTFVSSLDELAELKTPVGVDDADVAFRVFSEGVAGLIDTLLHNTPKRSEGSLAAGALIGQLCESRHWHNPQLRLKYEETVEELLRRLALSIEQARVFSADDGNAHRASISALIALQLALGRRKVDLTEDSNNFFLQLEKMEKTFVELQNNAPKDLLGACALLGLSHIATLYANGDELETFEMIQRRQHYVKPIAECILMSFLQTDYGKQQNKFVSFNGDIVFPLHKATEGSIFTDTFSTNFEQSSSDAVLIRWASLMGLSRLASGFSSIKRLDWLTNMRKILTIVWETDKLTTCSIAAVALGPVLLQCVHFNLAPSSVLEQFVATAIERTAHSDAGSFNNCFSMSAAAFVLCRSDHFGGFPSTIRNYTNLAVDQIKRTLEGESNVVRSLMVSGIANFFHLSFGISGSFVSTNLNADENMEFNVDSGTIVALMKLLRSEAECDYDSSSAVLGAIARISDRFYVSHKKKSFDVEVRTLPSNTFLVKTLEWLRQASPSYDTMSPAPENDSETHLATSLLGCLTSTGPHLPLLDYASLTHRVMLRFCSVDASVACVKFAATQGSCDELLAGELLSSWWFGNADVVLQAELIMWIIQGATRISTDILRTLLITVYDILKDIWRRDTSSSGSVLLFDSWTAMLSNILVLEQTQRIPESSSDMLKEIILEKITVELPFELHASWFVQQFAVRVLSKVDYGERGPSDTFLLSNMSNASVWNWWRNGVFTIELAKLKVISITKREASLMFQWILRHDFTEWVDIQLVNTHLQPLLAEIGALIAQHTRPAETATSILDVVDAFSRGMSSLDVSALADSIKCCALFAVMACALSWKSSLIHEQYLLKIQRSESVGMATATDLLPFGLKASAHSAKTLSTLGERLLALLQQLTRLDVDETVEYRVALEVCSKHMYISADKWHVQSAILAEIRELWSLHDTC